MSRRLIAVCAVLLLSSACLAQQPAPAAARPQRHKPQGPKKRVAVMSFEYGNGDEFGAKPFSEPTRTSEEAFPICS